MGWVVGGGWTIPNAVTTIIIAALGLLMGSDESHLNASVTGIVAGKVTTVFTDHNF